MNRGKTGKRKEEEGKGGRWKWFEGNGYEENGGEEEGREDEEERRKKEKEEDEGSSS